MLSTLALSLALALGTAPAAQAQEAPVSISIARQSLSAALLELAGQTPLQIFFTPDVVAGLDAPAVSGRLTPEQALRALLQGTGIDYERSGNSVTLRKRESVTELPAVSVTAQAPTNPSAAPPAYAGGQVAQGARLGMLGNRDILDTPFNMTSYTDDLIRNQQARTIADVVTNDVSVRNLVPASNGADGYYIRGFPVSNQDVAFDGLYGILPFWRTSIISAERIEVLKGPSALLTGMAPDGAIGGNINIVPKRAGDEPLTRLTTDYYSDGQFGGMLDLGRRFGPDNRFGIRLNAAYRDGDGALDNTSQRFGEFALGLDYRGERARVSLDVGYQDRRLDGVEGAAFLASGVTDIPAPPRARSNYYDSFSYWKDETTYGVLRGEYDLRPRLTAYAAVGARDYSDKYLLPSARELASNGNFTENFTRTAEYYHNVTAETGVRGEFDTGPVNHQFNANINTFNQETG